MAIKAGKIQVDENGKEIRSDKIKNLKEFQILHRDSFVQKQIVKEWVSDLLTRKQGKATHHMENAYQHSEKSMQLLQN